MEKKNAKIVVEREMFEKNGKSYFSYFININVFYYMIGPRLYFLLIIFHCFFYRINSSLD